MKYMPPEIAFMPPEHDAPAPQDSRALIIPFGLEKTVSYEGGTAKGPKAAIEASHELEHFDEVFWCEPRYEYGIATLEEPKIVDKLEDALDQLETITQSALDAGHFPLIIGGEHSLTAGAIRPYAKAHETLTILQFDAHADLRDGYAGDHCSHAAAMCRCLDHPNVRLVSVGIRNISASEIPFLEANKDRIEIFWAKDKAKWTAEDVAKAVGTGPTYITFDIDGFDASLIPATGTPEPGGLFWDEVMDILAATSKSANIVGADIVELSPREGLHACDFMTAKLAYKILSYALLEKRGQ
jgi:agmatinase